MGVIALNGGIQQRAAAGYRRIGRQVAKHRGKGKQAFDRGMLLPEQQGEAFAYTRSGIVEGLQRQLLLRIEVVVDTTLLQAGRSHDVRERRAEEALLIEERGCLLDDALSCSRSLTHSFSYPN